MARRKKIRKGKAGHYYRCRPITGGAGGAAAWYYGQLQSTPAPKIPVFLSLETFTVNLEPENSDQHLQTNLTLKVGDNEAVNKIKLHMPEVRNRVLLLLSSKTASQIATVEGKRNRHGTVGGDKPALWGGAAARRLKACFSLRSSFNNAMSNDFLSQEEVDALLKGVGNGPPASQQSAPPRFSSL